MRLITFIIFFISCSFLVSAQSNTEINVDKLPKKVHEYVKSTLPGGKIVRAATGTENGEKIYLAIVEINDTRRPIVFDKNGNFLRKANLSNPEAVSPSKPPVVSSPEATSQTGTAAPISKKETVSSASLPAPVQRYINQVYPKSSILNSSRLILDGKPSFQVIVNEGTQDHYLMFDEKGELTNKWSYPVEKSPFRKTSSTGTTPKP